MRSSTLWAAVLTTVLVLSASSAAQGADKPAEPYLGEISLFASDFAPRGWVFCEGQTLKITENEALFALLGTTYGGDERKDFKVPDLRQVEAKLRVDAGIDKDSKGLRYIIALEGIHPSIGKPGGTNRYNTGQVVLFASTTVPPGWAFCEGQTLAIIVNQDPFSLLGHTYGGEGRNDFKLPDLRKVEAKLRADAGIDKDAKGLRHIICVKGIFPERDRQSNSPLIGEIFLFAGSFAVAPCDGKTLPIDKNSAFFTLLNTTYGGDGKKDFRLPDLRKAEAKLRADAGLDKDAKGLLYNISFAGDFPARN